MIFPFSILYTVSQIFTVLGLCETMIIVFFFKLLIVSIINSSFFKSRELVASSKTKTEGLLYKALAIPILCFSPPEIFPPRSPTTELTPFSNLFIKSSN